MKSYNKQSNSFSKSERPNNKNNNHSRNHGGKRGGDGKQEHRGDNHSDNRSDSRSDNRSENRNARNHGNNHNNRGNQPKTFRDNSGEPPITNFMLGEKELEGKVAQFFYDKGSYTIVDIVGEEKSEIYKSRNSQEAYLKWNIYIGRKKERAARSEKQEQDA